MKKNYHHLLLILVFITVFNGYSQDNKTDDGPVRKSAFNKNIMQDINFMVLGDNNIKQGFSYELDKEKTELSLNALISNKKSYIISADGKFTTDDAAFIFDNKDGSKKGKISLNYFRPMLWNFKSFPAPDDKLEGAKATRKRILNDIQERELKKKALEEYAIYNTIIEILKIPSSSPEKDKTGFFSIFQRKEDWQYNQILAKNYADSKTVTTEKIDVPSDSKIYKRFLKYIEETDVKVKSTSLDDLKNLIADDIKKKNGEEIPIEYDGKTTNYFVPSGVRMDTLLKDYEIALSKIKNIDDKIDDEQIKNFSDIWLWQINTYLGISPYYEREGLDTYKGGETLDPDFTENFKEQRGDLYGLTFSGNYVARHSNGFFSMIRGLATFGRGSNFSDFKKKEYSYATVLDSIGSNPISEELKKTSYYTKNNAPYGYGFLQEYSIETYVSTKVLGVYGKIGYKKNDALDKKETYPFETGVMINLKSEKKNVVSILLFVSRKDLNVHPDDDMNFGFKIGLPINIAKAEDPAEKAKGS